MNNIYVIRYEDFSSGDFTSGTLNKAFKSYNKCLSYLKTMVEDDKVMYEENGVKNIDNKIIWNKDENNTYVIFDFGDDYSKYVIENLEVAEDE